jgi:signal recognition particle receptor subunit beta
MKDFKIVFTGPPGVGKTTAIAALSDLPPVRTEVRNTDASLGPTHTTVAMDFGQVDLGRGQWARLFGTPGQARFEFMWRIVAADAAGVVILMDNTRADPVGEFAAYLEAYRELLPHMTFVAGIVRTETRRQPSVDDYIEQLTERGLAFPVLEVDVRRRDDVQVMVDMLLTKVRSRL